MSVRMLNVEFMSCDWFACTDCADYYAVDDIYTIVKTFEGGVHVDWLLGSTLADFARDPECAGCFRPLAYGKWGVAA